MELYVVQKLKEENTIETVAVVILFNKADGCYHFVNLTKGHICPCAFKTVSDAIADMESKKVNGEILNYIKYNYLEVC